MIESLQLSSINKQKLNKMITKTGSVSCKPVNVNASRVKRVKGQAERDASQV